MRSLFLVAVVCSASVAQARPGLPDIPANGRWVDVTFHGVGTISDIYVENPAFSHPFFAGALSQTVDISVSFKFLRDRAEDLPFTDQMPAGIGFTRRDTGHRWGQDLSLFGEYYRDSDGFEISEEWSWWGPALAAGYQLGAGTGSFRFNLLEEDPGDPELAYWSEGGGSWTLTKVSAKAAIPEPGTWAMMILGLGMAGFRLRKGARQRSTA